MVVFALAKIVLFVCIASMAMTLHVVNGKASFLQTKIPNGDKWKDEEGKFLGHKDAKESLRTFLSTAFAANGLAYNEVLCKTIYEGTSMTVGEAFGDPCCKWTKVGDPLEPITPWAAGSLPTVKTVCPTASTTTTGTTNTTGTVGTSTAGGTAGGTTTSTSGGTVAGGTTGGGTAGGTTTGGGTAGGATTGGGTAGGATTGGGTSAVTAGSSTDAAIEIKTVKVVAAEDSSAPGTKGKSGRKAAKLDDDEEDVVVFIKSKKKRLHCRVKKSD